MELDKPTFEFNLTPDKRPRVPEPLEINLVSIDDVTLPANTGLEVELDSFYVGLIGLKRSASANELIYRADNHDIRIEWHEGLIERTSMRPLQIEVPLLTFIVKELIERQIEFTEQRGLVPGQKSLLLLDPAGNWVELIERVIVF